MNLVYFCLYLYLLLKPYYIFKSGSIQPADIIMFIGFLLFLVSKNKEKFLKIISSNYKFIVFVICTFIINGLYFINYFKYSFLISSLYYLFNFMAIVLFTIAFDNEEATKRIGKILKINLLIQLLLIITRTGRYYGSIRYMGTFNDPNQFGYFILISYMFIYLISLKYNNNKGNVFFLLISIYLIIECASTGMFVCITIFLLLQLFDIINHFSKFLKRYKNKIVIGSFILLPILLIFFVINSNYNYIDFSNILIITRIEEKIKKFDGESSSDVSLIKERGYDRFIYYPQYILYGSGEGEFTRFDKTFHQGEIHATFPSILFYYGIIPTFILLKWVYDKIKKINLKILIPLIALFAESFTLLNQRQALFWVLIIFSSSFIRENSTNID